MTAPFPSLVRYYVLSLYAPSKRGGGASPSKGRTDAKRIAKAIGIGVLALALLADIGSIFVFMNLSAYAALKPYGLQGLMILNSAITASAFILVIGFLTAISTYCMSQADSGLLALPLGGRSLLGAKMIMTFLSEFAFGFFLIAVAATIYAIKEAPPAPFYAGALLAAIAVPLVPLAAIYLMVVPLMIAFKPLRNKNATVILGGIVGLGLGLVLTFYFQSSSTRMADPAWVLKNLAGPDAIISRIGRAYFPAALAWSSMSSRGAEGLGLGAANLALGLAAAAIVALALGPAYAKSLLGFDELRLKRVAATRDFVSRTFRRRGRIAALVLREVRLMNREPVYLINGPFVVLLMPVILAVAWLAQKDALAPLLAQAASFKEGPGAMLAAAALGAFLGSSTSISCTAVSRDAKALPYLKSLPLPYRDLMIAKFLHGFAFAVLGAAIGGAGAGLVLGLGPLESIAAFLLALSFSSFTCIAGLWLDTANPRLAWDNPTAALKQNPNSSILIVGAMALLGAFGALSAILPFGKLAFFALYFSAFGAAAAALLAAYPRFAERRIAEIEA